MIPIPLIRLLTEYCEIFDYDTSGSTILGHKHTYLFILHSCLGNKSLCELVILASSTALSKSLFYTTIRSSP